MRQRDAVCPYPPLTFPPTLLMCILSLRPSLLTQARAQHQHEGKALQHVAELLARAFSGMSSTRATMATIVSMVDATIASLKSEATSEM